MSGTLLLTFISLRVLNPQDMTDLAVHSAFGLVFLPSLEFCLEFCSFQTSMCTLLALCQFVLYCPFHFDNCIHNVRFLVHSLFNDHK